MTVTRDNADNSIRHCLQETFQVIINKNLVITMAILGPSVNPHLIAA